jgi:hypothetical protein
LLAGVCDLISEDFVHQKIYFIFIVDHDNNHNIFENDKGGCSSYGARDRGERRGERMNGFPSNINNITKKMN